MKVKIIQSSVGSGDKLQVLASYVINDFLSLDAACIGFISPIDEQRQIEHVFLSHTHIDHTASLPIFIDNVYAPNPECPTVYGSATVLESLRTDVFNDRVWPDMIRLSMEETPFLKLVEVKDHQTIEINGLQITPVELNHVIPAFGFVVSDGESAFALVSDTSPTEEIWKIASETPNLKAVFLEASFPNHMDWLADKAGHLTPAMFVEEAKKLKVDADFIAIHIKAAFQDAILKELDELNMPNLSIGEPGKTYEF